MPVSFAADDSVDRQLSENFWLDEFDCKDGTPVPEDMVDDLAVFVKGNLQVLRDFVGRPIYITSAYRHRAYNEKQPGAAKHSYHIYGRHIGKFAVDIIVPPLSPPMVKLIIEGLINIGKMTQGGIGLYKDFVHYDDRGFRKRWT